MSTINRLVPWLCVPAAVALTAWVCTAAPILPAKPRVTEEIKSLAGIKRLRVVVESKSLLLQNMKYSPANIQEQVSDLMIEAGFEVVDDPKATTLRIVLLTNTKPTFPDVVSVTHHLSLEQDIVVARLGSPMFAPTYALVHGILVSKDRMLAELDDPIVALMQRFAQRVEQANEAASRT